jgi:hypothetical protein
VRQYSAVNIPQQNGWAERLNRTLRERARAMFADRSLPKHLWPFAMDTSSYLRNRVPGDGQEKAPYELFKKKQMCPI